MNPFLHEIQHRNDGGKTLDELFAHFENLLTVMAEAEDDKTDIFEQIVEASYEVKDLISYEYMKSKGWLINSDSELPQWIKEK